MFSLAFGLRGIYKLQPKKGKTKKTTKLKTSLNSQGRFFQEAFWGEGCTCTCPVSPLLDSLFFRQKPFLSSAYSPSHLNISSRGYKKNDTFSFAINNQVWERSSGGQQLSSTFSMFTNKNQGVLYYMVSYS